MSNPSARGPGDVTLMEITRALHGLAFPARRDELLAQAQRNRAHESVIACVRHLPDRRYDNATEIEEVCNDYSQHGGA